MSVPLRLALALIAALLLMALAAETARADSITATCTPGDCGAWQTSNVRLEWQVQVAGADATTGCELTTITQEGSVPKTCTALSLATGPLLFTVVTIRIDKTAPTVTTVTPGARPNALGWQTSPFNIVFQGSDASTANATSGIAGCTAISYNGPDTSNGSISGTCRDRAGNVSAPFTYTFKYDATPPALAPLKADADDRAVTLRWTRSEAAVEITRTPGIAHQATSVVYRGPARSFLDTKVRNGTTYLYRATVTDAAGHTTTQAINAKPTRGLLEPANGARVAGAPKLAWTQIRNADYYNVQVYRGGRKVLSVWPKAAAFALRSSWRFQGNRVRLTPGTYRVFVWPGFGAVAKQRYGRIVGSRTFVVRAR